MEYLVCLYILQIVFLALLCYYTASTRRAPYFLAFRVTLGILLLSCSYPITLPLEVHLKFTPILQFPLKCLIIEVFIYFFFFFFIITADIFWEEGVWSAAFVCFNLFHLMRHLRAAVVLTVKVIALQKQ